MLCDALSAILSRRGIYAILGVLSHWAAKSAELEVSVHCQNHCMDERSILVSRLQPQPIRVFVLVLESV